MESYRQEEKTHLISRMEMAAHVDVKEISLIVAVNIQDCLPFEVMV
jgi:hypothetical protein